MQKQAQLGDTEAPSIFAFTLQTYIKNEHFFTLVPKNTNDFPYIHLYKTGKTANEIRFLAEKERFSIDYLFIKKIVIYFRAILKGF